MKRRSKLFRENFRWRGVLKATRKKAVKRERKKRRERLAKWSNFLCPVSGREDFFAMCRLEVEFRDIFRERDTLKLSAMAYG